MHFELRVFLHMGCTIQIYSNIKSGVLFLLNRSHRRSSLELDVTLLEHFLQNRLVGVE